MNNTEAIGWISLLALVVVIVVYAPIGVIWAINTLFDTTIPFTFKTWAATFILLVAIKPTVNLKKD